MSNSKRLSDTRANTIINLTSKKQETALGKAVFRTIERLVADYDLEFVHSRSWYLSDIVAALRQDFRDVDFYSPTAKVHMRPDGGVLFVVRADGRHLPVLISEAKNQGTNDRRLKEGKKKQAMGNAIERLGKNVIGVRSAMLSETITPFVCFGYGIDFAAGSSILDRVSTIAMFGELNETVLHDSGPEHQFDRGSFYFRRKEWTIAEMTDILFEIADRSVLYYLSKYGKKGLRKAADA